MKRIGNITIVSFIICGFLSMVSICMAKDDIVTIKSCMPTARVWLSSCALNGKIYAIGGWNRTDLTTVEEYDPATDTWTRKANMPTPRCELSTVVVNDKIYAIGGNREIENGQIVDVYAVEEYNPATNVWTKKSDIPTISGGLAVGVINDRIYAIVNFGEVSIVEEYNPIMDTWTKKSEITGKRKTWSYTGIVNGKIYTVGGWDNDICSASSAIDEYDPIRDRFTEKANMPTARNVLSVSVLNGKIYAIGGWSGYEALSTVEEYDPIKNIWTRKTDTLVARYGLSTSVVNGKIYVMGGSVCAKCMPIPTVEEYISGAQSFDVSPQSKLLTTWGNIKKAG